MAVGGPAASQGDQARVPSLNQFSRLSWPGIFPLGQIQTSLQFSTRNGAIDRIGCRL